MPVLEDLTGQRFGRLVAIRYVRPLWEFVCDCGNTKLIAGANAKRGHTHSCGCLHRESSVKNGLANRKHGYVGKPEYRAFQSMHQRCGNPKDKDYAKYGGRGIKVCERWHDFNAFIEDMGTRPTSQHSLDRIDVNGEYGPDNCQWATAREQNYNKRRNTKFSAFGKSGCLAEFISPYSYHYGVVKRLINDGESAESALMKVCGVHC